MAEKISIHNRSLKSRIKGISKWIFPSSVRDEVLQFLSLLRIGKINRGFRVTESRCTKYLDMLRIPLEFLNKPTESIEENDIESFERALTSGSILSRFKGKPYALNTQIDIKKALKVFLRWRLGAARCAVLAGWLDTRIIATTPEYLSEKEVEDLYHHATSTEQRFAVAVLFDSGARAEEFLNIRFEDICIPKKDDGFVKITLKEEYSKSRGRVISLYWKHSSDAVREFLRDRSKKPVRSDEAVFNKSYDAMRKSLSRLGSRVLNKRINPHLFRHSSATYYASRLNRQELCYRYGWRFSSNMPDVYISRAGMVNQELDEKFSTISMDRLKVELDGEKMKNRLKEDRIERLEKRLEFIESNLIPLGKLLEKKPTVKDVKMALALKART